MWEHIKQQKQHEGTNVPSRLYYINLLFFYLIQLYYKNTAF